MVVWGGPGDVDGRGSRAVNRSLHQRRGWDAHHVIHREQAATIDLAGDGGEGRKTVGALGHTLADAAVGVGNDCTAVLVNRGVVEVEQVTRAVAAAAEASRANGSVALDGVVRRHIYGGVGRAAVIGVRDIEVPDAGPVGVVAPAALCGGGGAEEGKGRAFGIAGNDLGESCLLHALGFARLLRRDERAHVHGTGPGLAFVFGDGDQRQAIAVVGAEVHRAVRGDADRGVPDTGANPGHLFHCPSHAVVFGDGHSLQAVAAFVGDIDSAVLWRNFDVAVQAAAIGQCPRGNASAIGGAAVITAGAEGYSDVLRAVIDGVAIDGANQRGMEGSAADGLMVHAGGNAAPLAWNPGGTVVIGERREAVQAGQLRDEGAIGEAVGEKNRVQADQ